MNYRKEFFRLPVDQLRAAVGSRSVNVSFTMVAEAKEYRESVALSKMSPEKRENVERQEIAGHRVTSLWQHSAMICAAMAIVTDTFSTLVMNEADAACADARSGPRCPARCAGRLRRRTSTQ